MRLIDADALKQADFQDFSNTDVMSAIDDAPTIDPIKVGKWLPIKDDYGHHYAGCCSECGCEPPRRVMSFTPWNHCPNCGALMEKTAKWFLLNRAADKP